jgi:hypothetical protein
VELRGCTLVAVIGEQAKGEIGGRLFWHGLRTVAGDVAYFDDPCLVSVLFCLSVFRLLAWAEAGAYDGQYGCLFR